MDYGAVSVSRISRFAIIHDAEFGIIGYKPFSSALARSLETPSIPPITL